MSEKESLDSLKSLLNKSNYNKYTSLIEKFSKSQDHSIREDLAILLCDFKNNHSRKTLISLAHDKDYLVQSEALDSLSYFESDEVTNTMLNCMESRHPMVRGYAYLGYSWTCYKKNKKYAREKLSKIKEKDSWARINLLLGLALLGENECINKLIKMYPLYSYINKIRLLNGFGEIYEYIDTEDKRRICFFVNSISTSTMGVAELEAYHRLVEDLN